MMRLTCTSCKLKSSTEYHCLQFTYVYSHSWVVDALAFELLNTTCVFDINVDRHAYRPGHHFDPSYATQCACRGLARISVRRFPKIRGAEEIMVGSTTIKCGLEKMGHIAIQ